MYKTHEQVQKRLGELNDKVEYVREHMQSEVDDAKKEVDEL